MGCFPFMLSEFIEACQRGDFIRVKCLLAQSMSDTSDDSDTETIYTDTDTICRTLLKLGSLTNTLGFHAACIYGHTEIVSFILEDTQIDLNNEDKYGMT